MAAPNTVWPLKARGDALGPALGFTSTNRCFMSPLVVVRFFPGGGVNLFLCCLEVCGTVLHKPHNLFCSVDVDSRFLRHPPRCASTAVSKHGVARPRPKKPGQTSVQRPPRASTRPCLRVAHMTANAHSQLHLGEPSNAGGHRGNPCTALALCATVRLDCLVKNPHTDPFQTPSKLGHPSYPSSRRLRTTFPSHQMP